MEAPHLSALQKKYAAEGLTVLGINGATGDADQVRKFTKELGLTNTMLVGGSSTAILDYGAAVYPSLVWIDRKGVVKNASTRGGESAADLEAEVQKLLR